jgi:hypothetical protein
MGQARDRVRGWRGVATTLAGLVLLLRVLVPAGYMVDARAPSDGLVICTGHGALRLGAHGDSKGPAHRSADAPCAFAGAVTPVTPPAPAVIAGPRAIIFTAATVSPLPRDLAPGRGFAAPPPPAQGPPSV